MKKDIFHRLTLFAVLCFALAACNHLSTEDSKPTKKISIVASIYPQYDWTKKILGSRADSVDLSLLIKNGTDLHSYKPTASDIAKLANADLVVYVGGESDEWISEALAASPKADRLEINLMQGLGERVKAEEIVEGMETEHHEEHEHENHRHETHRGEAEDVENDEHVWLSIKNAEISVQEIAKALETLDSAHAKIYRNNSIAYGKKLRKLDADYQASIDSASRKTVLFGDRFPFRYLVDDYGITYYAAFVGCSAESEASFETVAFLAGKMDSLSLPAIFTLENGNEKIARAVLNASKNSKDAKILKLNSLESVTEKEIESGADYLGIMQGNLDVLKKALH